MQLAPYRPMEGDPKYVKINSVKQGTTRQAPNILKRTNNNYSTAVSYILIILLLATAIFITFKLIGSKQIQGEVAKTSTPVYALEAEPIIETKPVEALQQAPVTEPVIVPPVVETPAVVEAVQPPATCASEIAKYNWDTRIATAVMLAESGGNTRIVNNNPRTGDYSVGCFQVNIFGGNARNRPSEEQLKDPVVNVAFAYNLWRNTSWSQSWGAFSSGSYLRFMQ